MKYGILNENNELILAPKKLHIGNKFCYNPPETLLKEAGYYPIMETECPQDGNIYEAHYILSGDNIIQFWNKSVITYKDLIVSKVRTTYTIDDEIAILRQRYDKPEEFEAYYNFVEQCKAEAKAELKI